MTCQAACATSLHGCWVGAGPESSQASSSRQGRSRRGRFPASQALGGRPSGPPSPPSPRVAWKSLRGPRSSRARLHDAGLLLASVPEMATAWQQRAPGTVAINYLPAAAAVGQPTAPRCKYAALSAPARPAPPPARVEVPKVHRPFSSIECIPRHYLKVGKTITTKIKQTNKKNSGPEPQGHFAVPGSYRDKSGRGSPRPSQLCATGLLQAHARRTLRASSQAAAQSSPSSLWRWGAPSPVSPLRRGGWGWEGPPIAQTRFVSFLQP